MECLWMRRFGNPKWNVSHEFRNYSEGWATDEERDAQLEYRLSIVNAVEEDSGVYTCTTPPRYEHSVEILVEVSTLNEHYAFGISCMADYVHLIYRQSIVLRFNRAVD